MMPLSQTFDILLKQPVIISQQTATAGAHQSLDYIAGSAVLGMLANRLYSALSTKDAWHVFHSGDVRFSDALPIQENQIAYPSPLCWHHAKGTKNLKQSDGSLNAAEIFNPALLAKAELTGKQPVQLRDQYITLSGVQVKPTKEQTLKTAIDAKTGMAAESQLFGYEALSAGQTFRFSVDATDNIDTDLWQKICHHLTGEARLGRSRSAQFGSVTITKTSSHLESLTSVQPSDNTLTLWLLSDLWIQKQGQSCLIPEPSLLGLPEDAILITDRTFIRSRRYSLYNAYRHHYDCERHVISRGSVLCYQLSAPLDAAIESHLKQRIGLATESGLGQVWINPPLLAKANPCFKVSSIQPTHNMDTKPTKPANSLLIARLDARKNHLDINKPIDEAERIFDELCKRISQARRYKATANNTPITDAPNRTQFGLLKEA
ncbi:MAG: hypothetical protein KDI39_06050, partial [Pseudomonadales bacterium]|nr:hypothetical protein [Pseudomonadales bacterium]